MNQQQLPPVDVVMLGTFAMWNLGTLQARALPFARALQTRGVSAAIITTPWDMPGEAGIIDVIDGIPVINTAATSAKFPLSAVRQQLDWIKRLQPRLLHVMKPKGFGGMTAKLASNNLPVIVDSDDWEGDGGWNDTGQYSWPQRKVFHYQEQDLLQRATAVTAASTFLFERTAAMRTSRDPAVFLVENGLDDIWAGQLAIGRTLPPSLIDPPVIVLYSRFAEFGTDWLPQLIDALATNLDSPATLRLIGSLPEGTSLPDSPGLLTVETLGYVARGLIPELLGGATVAVYPYEDSLIARSKQSVKLLELMAAGCPVVGSDVGDVSRTISSAGVTLSGANPADFAGQVYALLSQPERLDEMSLAGMERIRSHFSFDYLTGKLLTAYAAAGLT